jgi:hypothetical protein
MTNAAPTAALAQLSTSRRHPNEAPRRRAVAEPVQLDLLALLSESEEEGFDGWDVFEPEAEEDAASRRSAA